MGHAMKCEWAVSDHWLQVPLHWDHEDRSIPLDYPTSACSVEQQGVAALWVDLPLEQRSW